MYLIFKLQNTIYKMSKKIIAVLVNIVPIGERVNDWNDLVWGRIFA